AVTEHSLNSVSSVKILCRAPKYLRHIQVCCNQPGSGRVMVPFALEMIKQSLIFHNQKVADLRQYGDRVGLFLWMLPQLVKRFKQFIHIGHVEISRQHKVPSHPVILPKEWMTLFDAVPSVRSVTQMSHQHLPDKGHVVLQPIAII